MLVLSTFRRLLSQVLTDKEDIHTAVLATPTGNLVSYASQRDVSSTKAEIRTIIGLACEIWGEEEKEDTVMAETDVSYKSFRVVEPSREKNSALRSLGNFSFKSSARPKRRIRLRMPRRFSYCLLAHRKELRGRRS